MIVRSCRECPFFQDPLGLLGLLGSVSRNRQESAGGLCGYHAPDDSLVVVRHGMPHGEARDEMIRRARSRMVIADSDTVPPKCPLYDKSVTITRGH